MSVLSTPRRGNSPLIERLLPNMINLRKLSILKLKLLKTVPDPFGLILPPTEAVVVVHAEECAREGEHLAEGGQHRGVYHTQGRKEEGHRYHHHTEEGCQVGCYQLDGLFREYPFHKQCGFLGFIIVHFRSFTGSFASVSDVFAVETERGS